jgi:hypothetical protein
VSAVETLLKVPTLLSSLDDVTWHSSYNSIRGDVLDYCGARSDDAPVADGHTLLYGCANADERAFANGHVTADMDTGRESSEPPDADIVVDGGATINSHELRDLDIAREDAACLDEASVTHRYALPDERVRVDQSRPIRDLSLKTADDSRFGFRVAHAEHRA